MHSIDIQFPLVTDNADDQRRWEESIVEKVKEISGVDVTPKFATPPYEQYINSIRWDIKRNDILNKYDGKCYICGSKDNIHVHHIKYIRLGDEHDDDLIPLCSDCHRKLHELKKELAPIIESVKNAKAREIKMIGAMRDFYKSMQGEDVTAIISRNSAIINAAIKKHVPKVIAGHKPKIASIIGNTLFYDIIGRACPINKDLIKTLSSIKKK